MVDRLFSPPKLGVNPSLTMLKKMINQAVQGAILDILTDLEKEQTRWEAEQAEKKHQIPTERPPTTPTAQSDDRNKRFESLTSRLDETYQQITSVGARLDARIDALGARLDSRIGELGIRLDGRIDGLDKKIGELTTQQSRMVDAAAGQTRGQRSTEDVEHRLARIEDRLFAHAG